MSDRELIAARLRVSAFLDEMERIDGIRRQYGENVYVVNDLPLSRADLRALCEGVSSVG